MHFMSAAELSITEAEHAALITVLHGFKKDAVPFVDDSDNELAMVEDIYDSDDVLPVHQIGFNMSVGTGVNEDGEASHCGSAACIGGHMHLTMQGFDTSIPQAYPVEALIRAQQWTQRKCYVSITGDSPLNVLFQPPGETHHWHQIKPAVAVVAIEHFLTTGKPTEAWAKALPELHDDE